MKLFPWRRSERRSISYQDLWGSGADIPNVRGDSIATALTLAPVYAATRLIADSIASLPLQVYREVAGKREKIDAPPVFADPTLFGREYEWVQRAMTSLLLRGNAYGLIQAFEASGWPSQIEWLHPDEVTLKENRSTSRPQWLWNNRPVDPWLGRDSAGQLLHIPWYVIPGEILGLSPLAAFRTLIESGILANRHGREWFQNSAIPAGTIKTPKPLKQEDAEVIKERFKRGASGREPVVLGGGMEFDSITVSAEESQFLQTIRATATQIASIYGIPPEMIGGETGKSMTYNNVEQQFLGFAVHTLRPYLAKLEASFSALLPRPQYVRFNLDALIRADTKTRFEAHAIALSNKFKTVNEVRALEDLAPLPGGDTIEKEAPPAPPPFDEDGDADADGDE